LAQQDDSERCPPDLKEEIPSATTTVYEVILYSIYVPLMTKLNNCNKALHMRNITSEKSCRVENVV